MSNEPAEVVEESDIIIRLATAEDQANIFQLITDVFDEYGYTSSKDDGELDLYSIHECYFDRGGAFWVMVAGQRVIGSHAALPTNECGVCTFRRLYLARDYRGSDQGRQLMQVTLDWAKSKGFRRVEFWSDVKFNRAHRFFEKLGFRTTGETRSMHDGIQPYQEKFYFLDIDSS